MGKAISPDLQPAKTAVWLDTTIDPAAVLNLVNVVPER
jgi:hypothetical protein